MLRGKPFHHFRGTLHYHFLRRRGVNKIFVLFPQSLVLQGFSGTKKDLAEKSARSLLIFGFALLFISGFALNHSINLAKILYHTHLGKIKMCSAMLSFSQNKILLSSSSILKRPHLLCGITRLPLFFAGCHLVCLHLTYRKVSA